MALVIALLSIVIAYFVGKHEGHEDGWRQGSIDQWNTDMDYLRKINDES